MPNLATLLKEEISKLARKEVQDQTRELVKTIKEQNARIARLEKQDDQPKAKAKGKAKAKAKADKPAPAKKAAAPVAAPAAAPAAEPAAEPAPKRKAKTRFSPASFKNNRKRLNLSQADVGVLLGTSTNTVLRWEAGSSKPRDAHLPKIAALSKMGKKQAKQELEQRKAQAGE